MPKKKDIADLAHDVADTMVDWNYHPEIYAVEITEVETLEDMLATIKHVFRETEPFDEVHTPCTKEEMFDELTRYFTHDETPNSDITVRDIPKAEVKKAWQELLQEIEKYITKDSKIYTSTLEDGLPITYIFWRFAYIILNKGGTSLFLFGAAYD